MTSESAASSGDFAPPDWFEKLAKSQQMSARVFKEGMSVLDGKFKGKFGEQHKRLKASIHRC